MAKLLSILFLILVLAGCDESEFATRQARPTQTAIDYDARLATIFDGHDGVASVEMTNVQETATGWMVYAEVTMYSGWNTLEIAKELQRLALALLVSARVDFSVILTDDEHGAVDYSRWTYRDDWIVTPLTTIGNG
ncbi:hypothetical protein LCGC14_1709180 [marine sediment metagenome]|uniref:Uncharacterized protein n=1 Tax=marine sediment metagenome TaxID=412755 RepID=A0A0F9JW78_9ZZZZ